MKIALLNTSDHKGGAAVVTMRLTHAFRQAGHDARLITYSLYNPDAPPYVCSAAQQSSHMKSLLLERGRIFMANGFRRDNLFKVSIANTGLPLHKHPWAQEADVIVLNWINQGLLSLNHIKKLGRLGKPIVWVMHDLWCMTGICHHPYECRNYERNCGYCPFLGTGAGANDLSHKTWRKKKALFDSMPIHFVAVSNWVAEKCRASSLLAGRPISMIHHAFPLAGATEPIKGSLHLPGIDYSKKLILMGAARLDDPIKGLDKAIDALNFIFDNYPDIANTSQAVFMGDIRHPELLRKLRMQSVRTGPLSDSGTIRNLYEASSVVLSASYYETVGATLIEGQAAGCVPVAFDAGGQSDVISHKYNGYLAKPYDATDLAAGIRWALQNPPAHEVLLQSVAEKFAPEVIVGQYIELFNRMLRK